MSSEGLELTRLVRDAGSSVEVEVGSVIPAEVVVLVCAGRGERMASLT